MQAIILAGGSGKSLSILTTGTCKAELPVANTPLIAFPLKLLANAGIKKIIVVAEGSMAHSFLSSWCSEYNGSHGDVSIQVEQAPEDATIVDCLSLVASKITSKNFIVVSGDVITDQDLAPIIMKHTMKRALATVVLAPVRTPANPQSKPSTSKAQSALIGLDPSGRYLVHYQASALPYAWAPKLLFQWFPSITFHNKLLDGRLYVLSREVLSLIQPARRTSNEDPRGKAPATPPEVQNLLPLLLQECSRRMRPSPRFGSPPQRQASGAGDNGMARGSLDSQRTLADADEDATNNNTGYDWQEGLGHGEPHEGADGSMGQWPLRAHVVPVKGCYYQRVNSMEGYLEANKEVSASELMHLAGLNPSKPHDNVVPDTVICGNKSTVGSGCVLGESVVLGDKANVKRSVIGNSCKLGNGTKVLNCVLMDDVEVGDDCKLQGSIICRDAKIGNNCVLIDCQVGRGAKVLTNKDARGETLMPT